MEEKGHTDVVFQSSDLDSHAVKNADVVSQTSDLDPQAVKNADLVSQSSDLDQHAVKNADLVSQSYDLDPHAVKKAKVPKYVWVKTMALFSAWISMGLAHAMVWSTVPDMRTRLGVNMEEYSRTYTAMSIGGIIGAPLGVVGDRYDKAADGINSACLLVAATAFTLRPWSMVLWVLIILSFVEGMAWTCLNSIGNSMIMNLWGNDGNAPMHLLHFGYPLGSVIGPLIASLYVSDEETGSNFTTTESVLFNNTQGSTEQEPRFADESEIEIAYAIVGAVIAVNGIFFVIFQCVGSFRDRSLNNHEPAKQDKPSYTWGEVMSPTKWGAGDKKFGLTIVLLVMAFYFLLIATFKASTTYYVTYASDSHLGFTNSEAAIYSSITSFAGATGRACSIVAAKFVAIQPMIFVEVYGMVAAMILMAFWGHKGVTSYWVTSVLVLFFRDPVWPSAMTWTDKYVVLFAIVVGLTDMSGKTSGAIVAWVLGYMYTYVSMESIFYVSAVFGVLLCILLIFMHVIATRHGGRYEQEKMTVLVANIENDSVIALDSNCNLVNYNNKLSSKNF